MEAQTSRALAVERPEVRTALAQRVGMSLILGIPALVAVVQTAARLLQTRPQATLLLLVAIIAMRLVAALLASTATVAQAATVVVAVALMGQTTMVAQAAQRFCGHKHQIAPRLALAAVVEAGIAAGPGMALLARSTAVVEAAVASTEELEA